MTRTVPEWIGATDDAMPPRSVRLRVFAAYDGRCWLSGRKIGPADKWDLDHKTALCNGGENREGNLAPALRDRHREKTARDVSERAKTERMRANYLGLKPKGRGFNTRLRRKMNGTVEVRS